MDRAEGLVDGVSGNTSKGKQQGTCTLATVDETTQSHFVNDPWVCFEMHLPLDDQEVADMLTAFTGGFDRLEHTCEFFLFSNGVLVFDPTEYSAGFNWESYGYGADCKVRQPPLDDTDGAREQRVAQMRSGTFVPPEPEQVDAVAGPDFMIRMKKKARALRLADENIGTVTVWNNAPLPKELIDRELPEVKNIRNILKVLRPREPVCRHEVCFSQRAAGRDSSSDSAGEMAFRFQSRGGNGQLLAQRPRVAA